MYCHNCGKEIDNGVKKCPHCGSEVFNAYVEDKKENRKEEKKEDKKDEKRFEKLKKKPSLVPLKVTSIVMYSILSLFYIASTLNNFISDRPIGFKTVSDFIFSVMFTAMLVISIRGRIDKRLSLIAMMTYCVFEMVYNCLGIYEETAYLLEVGNLKDNWYILTAIILRVLTVAAMAVVLAFSFVFHLKRKFSAVPTCISCGILIIIEVLALLFNIVIMSMKLVPFDLFSILSLFALYTYMGITIAQAFLFHSQDKYRILYENRAY